MRYNLKLAEAFHKTDIGLDGILVALGKEQPPPPPPNPKTVVIYQNGDVAEYLIEGQFVQSSIPNKAYAVKAEIGTAVTSIGLAAFDGCSGLTSITIPDSVTKIGTGAFGRCSSLSSITIPSNMTSIGDYAFTYCSSLTSIICQPTTAPTVQMSTFGDAIGAYTGYPTRGSNVLKVPQEAIGYDSSYWLDPFQNASKCGFHIEYI